MKQCLETISAELDRCCLLHPDFSSAKVNLQKIYRVFYATLPPDFPGPEPLTRRELCRWLGKVEGEMGCALPQLKRPWEEFYLVLKDQFRANKIGLAVWDRIINQADHLFPQAELATMFLCIIQNLLHTCLPPREKTSHAKWMQGTCPSCSALPHYALLTREGGVKVLECWRCSQRWVFPRMMCPYCTNANQEHLGYFTLADETYYRVQFCQQCGKYHKVFDARYLETDDLILPIHNLATLAADQVAIGEGFHPGSGLTWAKPLESGS